MRFVGHEASTLVEVLEPTNCLPFLALAPY
jgi:hypothetical protein